MKKDIGLEIMRFINTERLYEKSQTTTSNGYSNLHAKGYFLALTKIELLLNELEEVQK